jgi:hypothetical protein
MTIDPEEVSWGANAYSSAARPGRGPGRGGIPSRRTVAVTLTHKLSGISVTAEAVGPFTRAQKRAAETRLFHELLSRLEQAVAEAKRREKR